MLDAPTPKKGEKKHEYFTMRVRRPLSSVEQLHVDSISDESHRAWEIDRYTVLLEIAVLARDEKHAVSLLRKLLSSPKLVIERRKP